MKEAIKIILTKFNISKNKLYYKIIRLNTFFGISLSKNYNYLIVSSETKKNAILINKIRCKNNKKKIKIKEIKMELDDNLNTISTTRILNNEITKYGKII